MMKVLGPIVSKILLGLFMAAVFALTVILTFGSLSRIFPGDLLKAGSGLVLLDIAALVWFLVLVYASHGAMQRGIAFLMFLLSVAGVGLFAGFDSMMSGQDMVEVPAWAGEAVIYTFVLLTFANLFVLYLHHLNDPNIANEMRVQAGKDKLISRGMDKFEERLDQEAEALADTISDRMHTMALLDMNLGGGTVVEGHFSEPTQLVVPPEPANPTPPAKGRK